MRENILAFVMLLLLPLITSCQTDRSDTIVPLKAAEMTPELYSAIKVSVAKNLKDPYSADFGPAKAMVRLRNGIKEVVVCGYVNAKNSFGGYNGMQPYVGLYSEATQHFELIAMGDESPNAALLIQGSCRSSGIPIS